ncbi:FimV/HubP family polar landmark protein [Hydrogenophaga sp.]|uniref:FimV/HubP family polar landmark protein n=1 Tax=Hydrogenophaga sp. TaxID=1904254 RepID=UPI002721CAC2|nr:FimV/HubP family polar landmark protein [Hydrogenophaga sp.]MDO9437384.1 FimV/HubP family polar landmark protein [Hydrogenophaga sp.]
MRLHAVAAAALLCAGLAQHPDANALALGRVVVQSALGEPLRAEIDVPDINPDEAASLRVGLASGDTFRAAGAEVNAAIASLQISLQRRADGRAYLRLTGSRPVTEPFVDLIVEANWSTGRIVRDYTLLFDPPNQRAATRPAPAPVAPNVSAAAPPTAQQAPRPVPAPSTSIPQTQPPRPAPAPVAQAPAPVAPSPTPSANEGGGQVRVRAGETAGAIAAANKPSSVSLDQMLVAMLQQNPNAFIGGNVNRMKSGVVMNLPSAAEASAVTAAQARQTIVAQSRDFNEFRRRLAGAAPDAGVSAADRQATGQVQTEVKDAKPAAPAADKLTLAKPTAPGQATTEDNIAKERQAREASTRVAELSRNIEELSKLGTPGAAAPAPSAAATPPAAAPAAPAPTVTVPTAPAPTEPAPAPAPAAEPPATAPQTPAAEAPAAPAAASEPSTTPAPVKAPLPVPTPLPDEPSFFDQLRDNPLALPLAGGLLALLAGLGIYRMRQRKHNSNVDSSFLESRLQPDSFFGSSGGQRIDTAESAASGSSMVYSPSQLDAAGDVDPVAEADVYLAYGRDLQAEEILKEAMRSTPTRVAIHNKLLEIYAKRRDARAFEVVATEAFGLTQGQGAEWEHACELGKELDPGNPLYKPGGSPAVKMTAPVDAAGVMHTMPFGASTLDQPGKSTASSGLGDLDLDLDFSLDEPANPAPVDAPIATGTSSKLDLDTMDIPTSSPEAAADGPPSSMSMDFDLDFPSGPAPLSTADPINTEPVASVRPDLEFEDEPFLDLDALDALDASTNRSPSAPSVAPEMISFDLNDINLDLETPPAQDEATSSGNLTEENPLETKLSLAEEFRAIGDFEGARSLAEEVLAEASGSLKTKASTFLADLA